MAPTPSTIIEATTLMALTDIWDSSPMLPLHLATFLHSPDQPPTEFLAAALTDCGLMENGKIHDDVMAVMRRCVRMDGDEITLAFASAKES